MAPSMSIHYSDVIMSSVASEITGAAIVCLTVCSGADQRKHQSSTSLAFVRGIHRSQVDSPHKGPLKREMFPFDDVIMICPANIQVNCVIKHGSFVQSVVKTCLIWFKSMPFIAQDKSIESILNWYSNEYKNDWLVEPIWSVSFNIVCKTRKVKCLFQRRFYNTAANGTEYRFMPEY